MAFDLDQFRAAHQPWSVRLHGHTYRARWLSADEVMQYPVLWSPGPSRAPEEASAAFAARAEEHRKNALTAAVQLLRRAFPWRPVMLLYGDPVAVFQRAHYVEQQLWLRDFFASQAALIAALTGTPSTS